MRSRCSHVEAAIEPVGPRLDCPEDAATVLRACAGVDAWDSVVVLVCDDQRRVMVPVAFDGAPIAAGPAVLDCVIASLRQPTRTGLVVGIFRSGGSTLLDDDELADVEEVGVTCERAGVDLLDVIVLTDRHWSSLSLVAGAALGDDNGDSEHARQECRTRDF